MEKQYVIKVSPKNEHRRILFELIKNLKKQKHKKGRKDK